MNSCFHCELLLAVCDLLPHPVFTKKQIQISSTSSEIGSTMCDRQAPPLYQTILWTLVTPTGRTSIDHVPWKTSTEVLEILPVLKCSNRIPAWSLPKSVSTLRWVGKPNLSATSNQNNFQVRVISSWVSLVHMAGQVLCVKLGSAIYSSSNLCKQAVSLDLVCLILDICWVRFELIWTSNQVYSTLAKFNGRRLLHTCIFIVP